MTIMDKLKKAREEQKNGKTVPASEKTTKELTPELKITAKLSAEAQKFADENFGPVDKETVDKWIEEAKDNPLIAVSVPDNYFEH